MVATVVVVVAGRREVGSRGWSRENRRLDNRRRQERDCSKGRRFVYKFAHSPARARIHIHMIEYHRKEEGERVKGRKE